MSDERPLLSEIFRSDKLYTGMYAGRKEIVCVCV